MLDEMYLGRDLVAKPFENELEGSYIACNRTVEGYPTIVSEQLELELAVSIEGFPDPVAHQFFSSRFRQFEKLKEIDLTKDCLPPFNPNFKEDDLAGLCPGTQAFHRIIDIDSKGAVLFHTSLLTEVGYREFAIADEGYFLQPRYDREPQPVPEGGELRLAEDKDYVIIFRMDNVEATRILRYDPSTNQFENVKFTGEVTDFLGGRLDGRYLCMVSGDGPDGSTYPFLADVESGTMRRVSKLECPVGISTSGVVVGHSLKDDGTIKAGYMYPNGKRGALLTDTQNSHLSPLPTDVCDIDFGISSFHLVTGSLSEMTPSEKDPLGEVYLTPRYREGVLWIASAMELRSGTPVKPQPIQDRIRHAAGKVINLSGPTSDMRVIAETAEENLLLVPTE